MKRIVLSLLVASVAGVSGIGAASAGGICNVPQAEWQPKAALQKKLEGDLTNAKTASQATEKPIRSIAYSADGKILATAGDDHRGFTEHPAGGGVEQSCAVQHADVLMGQGVGGERGSRQRQQEGDRDERAAGTGSHGR